MNTPQQRLSLIMIIGFPIGAWLFVATQIGAVRSFTVGEIFRAAMFTPSNFLLISAPIVGLALAIFLAWKLYPARTFGGAPFKKYLRGTRIVTAAQLRRMTKKRGVDQVMVAGIPMPVELENRNILVSGSPGSGKSVTMDALVWSIMRRAAKVRTNKDRMVIVDPGGAMLRKFWMPGDKILNPYDARTEGWSIFNEIRDKSIDWKTYSKSIVPLGQSPRDETWHRYARTLLVAVAVKLNKLNVESMTEVYKYTTLLPPKDLRDFLHGTDAESLFVENADEALGSARFTLSGKIEAHKNMPEGSFSLRAWLEDPKAGNLFIPIREDMAESMKPLVSSWVDVICAAALSLPEGSLNLWLFLDELASLDKLASLQPAATKGRKGGLKIVAAIQSTAQVAEVYGELGATILRSCFKSLVVLAGSKSDPKTADDMSRSINEHEVIVDKTSKSFGRNKSRNEGEEVKTQRLVTGSEIVNLKDLTGYVAFGGDLPVAKVDITPINFVNRIAPFIARNP